MIYFAFSNFFFILLLQFLFFFFFFQNDRDLNEVKLQLYKRFEETHQFIIVLRGPLENISQAYVIFNDQIFTFSDPLKAVDVCFKCYAALRYWPNHCSCVWQFFQLYVYNILKRKSIYFINQSIQTVNKLITNLKNLAIPKVNIIIET